MTFPKQSEIDLPLLLEIARAGGAVRPQDVYLPVAKHFPELTADDLRQRLESARSSGKWINMIQWARQRLVDRGALDPSTRGVWKITPRGYQMLRGLSRAARPGAASAKVNMGASQDAVRVKRDLLESIDTLDAEEFADLFIRLRRAIELSQAEIDPRQGFPAGEATKKAPRQRLRKGKAKPRRESKQSKRGLKQDDIVRAVRKCMGKAPWEGVSRKDLTSAVAHELGFQRAGRRISEAIDNGIRAAAHRRVVQGNRDRIRFNCRTIEDYPKDFLVDRLAMQAGRKWKESDEVLVATARHLGFARLGKHVRETLKTLLKDAERSGVVEIRGDRVRKRVTAPAAEQRKAAPQSPPEPEPRDVSDDFLQDLRDNLKLH